MEEKRPENIDYYTYEEAMARAERHVTRWIAAFVIAFFALIGTNLGWIIYESQYQDVVVSENTQDGDGINLIGGGDVNYGTDTTNGQD